VLTYKLIPWALQTFNYTILDNKLGQRNPKRTGLQVIIKNEKKLQQGTQDFNVETLSNKER
jgi:hypothetical protein